MPSETPITASLTLLGLGLKLRMRWKNGICCVGRGAGFCEDEVVVIRGSLFVSVWDSSSMVVEGSIVVFEVDVLVLWMVDEAIAVSMSESCIVSLGTQQSHGETLLSWSCLHLGLARVKLTELNRIKIKRQFKFFLRKPMLMFEPQVGIHNAGASKYLRLCARRCRCNGTQ